MLEQSSVAANLPGLRFAVQCAKLWTVTELTLQCIRERFGWLFGRHTHLLLVSGDTNEGDMPVASVARRAAVGAHRNAFQSSHLRHAKERSFRWC